MKRDNNELLVGLFVVIGILALTYLSIRLGDVRIFGEKGYSIFADFDSTSGLREGAEVEVAGVVVGRVVKIFLKDYSSRVEMRIKPGIKLPEDTIASIRTRGLIGERFIKMMPGGSERYLRPGEKIRDTESSVDIEELISKYIFSLEEK
ncbi:MAG: outer membrane lipid asymmetry maintenance protein MlaD [Nitrospirae bacterium]|nr:outer membrane lipid asymmetry maintenance protein MlaD [Nitrospirota bacterium]